MQHKPQYKLSKTSSTNQRSHNELTEKGTSLNALSIIENVNQQPTMVANLPENDLSLADIFGRFGLYQLSLTLFTLVRYTNLAMMAYAGPLIAPDLDYWCDVSNSTKTKLDKPPNETIEEFLNKKCLVKLIDGQYLQCDRWTYNTSSTGETLTNAFDLVCDRDYLRSTIQGSISAGVVIAAVFWGSISDRHGRYRTSQYCFICSLLTGLVSYVADNLLVYSVSRLLCSFSDLGLALSLTTLLVETVGNDCRGTVVIIVSTGWSVGVMIMPWLVDYFRDYRMLTLCTVAMHMITLPWLMSTRESVRWLLINGRFAESLAEIKRIGRWAKFGLGRAYNEDEVQLESDFESIKPKYVTISARILEERRVNDARWAGWGSTVDTLLGSVTKVDKLFEKRKQVYALLTLIWINFNSEFLYMLFVSFSNDIGTNVKLNYALGGLMEVLSTIFSIGLISVLSRKFSITLTLSSICGLSLILAFTYDQDWIALWILNISKFAISTLTSLMYVIINESFPTKLRQTGVGITGTLGSLGAVVAPFVRKELTDAIGMRYVMMLVALGPQSAAFICPFFLEETKEIEIADDFDEY